MKRPLLFSWLVLALGGCKHHPQLKDPDFQAESIEKTATITLHGPIDRVFPLFGAFEERKWSDGWNPVLLYPGTEFIREGTTFLTHGHGHGEDHFTWIVNRYDSAEFLIQYLVYSENRHWTITITCKPLPGPLPAPLSATPSTTRSATPSVTPSTVRTTGQTEATITYRFTGHNALGNAIDRHMLEIIYEKNLADWVIAIDAHLAKAI